MGTPQAWGHCPVLLGSELAWGHKGPLLARPDT